jgi:hypothetical protein
MKRKLTFLHNYFLSLLFAVWYTLFKFQIICSSLIPMCLAFSTSLRSVLNSHEISDFGNERETFKYRYSHLLLFARSPSFYIFFGDSSSLRSTCCSCFTFKSYYENCVYFTRFTHALSVCGYSVSFLSSFFLGEILNVPSLMFAQQSSSSSTTCCYCLVFLPLFATFVSYHKRNQHTEIVSFTPRTRNNKKIIHTEFRDLYIVGQWPSGVCVYFFHFLLLFL